MRNDVKLASYCLWFLVSIFPGSEASTSFTLRVAFISELSGPQQVDYYDKGFANFAVPYINARGGLPLGSSGEVLQLEVVKYDAESDEMRAIECVEAARQGLDMAGNSVGDIDVIVAGTFRLNAVIIDAAQQAGIPNIHASGGNPTLWKVENTFAFGMHLPFIWYTRGLFTLASIRGMRKVSIIRTYAHGFSRTSCIAALAWAQEADLRVIGPSVEWCHMYANQTGQCRILNSSGIERCVCGEQSDVDALSLQYRIAEGSTFYEIDERLVGNGLVPGAVDGPTTEFVRGMLRDMRMQGEPEALLNFAQEWHNVLNALWLEEMSPKMLFGWQGTVVPSWAEDSTGTTNSTHGLWAVGFGQWQKAMAFRDPVFGSNANAVETYESTTGEFLGYDAAGGIAIAVLLHIVLSKYVEESFPLLPVEQRRDSLRIGISQMNDETLWGLIRFNRFNQNNGRGTAAWQILPEAQGEAFTIQQRCVLPSDAAEVELQIPFPTWGSRFGCGPGEYNTGAVCEPCAEGSSKHNRSAGVWRSSCETCQVPLGTLPGEVGAAACSACPAGRSNQGGLPLGVCSSCQSGYAFDPDVHSDAMCHRCPAGTYANSPMGASSCTACQPGQYTRQGGATGCFHCAPGYYSSEPGLTGCLRCDVGRFQAMEGQLSCSSCSAEVAAGSVTAVPSAIGADDCLCPESTYLLREIVGGLESSPVMQNSTWEGACVPCPDGLLCETGRSPPLQAAGYHGGRPLWEGGPPSFVVACRNDKICPEGSELGTCPEHRVGRACDRCQRGFGQEDDSCEHCSGRASWFPLAILVFGCSCAITLLWFHAAYCKSKVATQDMLTLTITSSMVVNALQALGALGKLTIDWMEPLRTIQAVTALISLKVDILNLNCIFNHNDVVLSYLASLAIYLIFVMALFACMMVPAPAFFAKLHWRLARRKVITWEKIWNAQGLCMLVAYLSLAVVSVAPWKCEANPDGSESVADNRSVLCWQDDRHTSMLVLSMLGIISYILLFAAIVARAVLIYPIKMTQREGHKFARRYEFLFKRFHPQRYYWAVVYLMRNLSLALIPVILSNEPELQMLVMAMLIVSTGFLQARVWPWRTAICNCIDSGISVALALVMYAGHIVLELHSAHGHKVVQVTVMVILGSSFAAILCVILFQFYRMLFPRSHYGIFLSHHKGSSQVLARWFKIQLSGYIKDNVFLDSDELDELGDLLTVVAKKTKNLVLLLSSKMLWRMWCACEVVTAHQFCVNMVLVASEDYLPPTDEQIVNLDAAWTDDQKSELQVLGVTIDEIRRCFHHLREQPVINLVRRTRERVSSPSQASRPNQGSFDGQHYHFTSESERNLLLEAIEKRCGSMRSRMPIHCCSSLVWSGLHSERETENNVEPAVWLLSNPEDPETYCCALVIIIMLQQEGFANVSTLSLSLNPALHELQDHGKLLLPLLSSGCMENLYFTALTVVAARDEVGMIPVVADSRFGIPDRAVIQAVGSRIQNTCSDIDMDGYDVTEAYRTLFHTIALNFSESGSGRIQRAEVLAIKSRCEGKLKAKKGDGRAFAMHICSSDSKPGVEGTASSSSSTRSFTGVGPGCAPSQPEVCNEGGNFSAVRVAGATDHGALDTEVPGDNGISISPLAGESQLLVVLGRRSVASCSKDHGGHLLAI